MSQKSSPDQIRDLGSAKQGSHHWWMQIVSALVLIPLGIWFVASILQLSSTDYSEIRIWIANPLTSVLLIIMLIALYYHVFLGLQVIIEDYINSVWRKISCLLLVKFLSLFAGVSSIYSVLKISLGS